MSSPFDLLDSSLFRWFLETYIPLECYPFCEHVNKRWHQYIASIYARSPLSRVDRKVKIHSRLVKQHRIDLLQWLWQSRSIDQTLQISLCIFSARHGAIDVLKWLYTYNRIGDEPFPWHRLFQAVGHGGSVECLEWAFEHAPPLPRIQGKDGLVYYPARKQTEERDSKLYILKVAVAALENGHIPILQWVKEHHPKVAKKLYHSATLRKGHWECFTWCYDNGLIRHGDEPRKAAIRATAYHGDPVLLAKVCAHKLYRGSSLDFDGDDYYDEITMMDAVRSKQLQMVKEIKKRGSPITEAVLKLAVKFCPMDVLRWLFEEEKHPVTKQMVEVAANKRTEEPEIVRYLMQLSE